MLSSCLTVSVLLSTAQLRDLDIVSANKNQALNSLLGAAFGAAGQRCMAISVAILVGNSREWLPELVERAKKLKVGQGFDKDADL